jgi:hypothetical protein
LHAQKRRIAAVCGKLSVKPKFSLLQTREKESSAAYGEILADIKILTYSKIITVLQQNKRHRINRSLIVSAWR